ncbi:hypothetical protein FIBSPDRAFT_868733 [Athelia psychrophila]|uniref:Uncharacterized protein n=1 Tax=Athelia psychrophila TaxID=1759441 RepID=A0A166CU62_9AGAM|nr:hypothetical protein FIBSPDRAFT_868733 [Fibularhizoctonia sp. CBS 109695]
MSLEWSLSASCVLGIAIVLKRINGFLACQWALALHPSDYCAPDARIFQIVRDRNSTLWRVHQAQGHSSEGTSAFFHLAHIPYPPNVVHCIIEHISPHQKNWDTHGLVWTSETWVLRAIEVITSEGVMRELACPLANVHEIFILRATNMLVSKKMQVVHNWLPPLRRNRFSDNRHKTQPT